MRATTQRATTLKNCVSPLMLSATRAKNTTTTTINCGADKSRLTLCRKDKNLLLSRRSSPVCRRHCAFWQQLVLLPCIHFPFRFPYYFLLYFCAQRNNQLSFCCYFFFFVSFLQFSLALSFIHHLLLLQSPLCGTRTAEISGAATLLQNANRLELLGKWVVILCLKSLFCS